MAWPAGTVSRDFWAEEFGAAAPETEAFAGPVGLDRLTGPQRIFAPDPEGFRASLTRIRLDHVALEYFAATPHTVDRGADEIAAYPTPLLTLIHLLEGAVEVRLPQTSFTVRAGESIILDSRQPIVATATDDVRALRSVVGVEHVPPASWSTGATIPGVLPRTALLDSFTAFIASVLRSMRERRNPQGEQLIAAIAQLQTAVFEEAQQAVRLPQAGCGLRDRIEEHIQRHHTDPRLDVAAIARALDISVRHAHGVFNEGDRTIAAVLRDRRVATAALLLRTRQPPTNIANVAHEAGFADRDAFTRAFRRRYGMTPSEYHHGGHLDAE